MLTVPLQGRRVPCGPHPIPADPQRTATKVRGLPRSFDDPTGSMTRPKDHNMSITDCTAPAAAPTDLELIPLSAFLRRFSASKSSFYRMAAQGEAPDVVKLGRATFVPLAAAKKWMAARVRPAQSICRTGGAA
jgi:predicted DNA-binding transcriptional regulator AlpA